MTAHSGTVGRRDGRPSKTDHSPMLRQTAQQEVAELIRTVPSWETNKSESETEYRNYPDNESEHENENKV